MRLLLDLLDLSSLHEEETDPKGQGMLWSCQWARSWIPGTTSAQAGPAENWVHAVAVPFGNAAGAGDIPRGSMLPSSISRGGNATAATRTVPMLHAGCPAGACAAGVSPGPAGQERLLPRSRSTRGDPGQRQQQAPTPVAVPYTPSRKHLGDAPAKSLASRRALGRARTCRESVPISLPSIPALCEAAQQRAYAHRPWAPGPGTAWWGAALQPVARAGWGDAYLLPRGVGSVGPGTGPQAPRVSV